MKTRKRLDTSKIPVVIICWNSLTFIKKLVDQLKSYPNPIILLDNKSTYKPLFQYYKQIKAELKDKIEIRLLDKNYGSGVFLKQPLPKVFIMTDPDIEINEKMPQNFAEILLNLSNKYKVYKVGAALKIKDKNDFVRCASEGNPLYEYQLKYWKEPIENKDYELYNAAVDSTFTLVNNNFLYKVKDKNYTAPAIRIAGDFTAKHLPWYKKTLEDLSGEELYVYMKHNKSSTFVRNCLNPMLKEAGKTLKRDTIKQVIKDINSG